MPGPPYQFLDRITAIHAEPWKLVAGGVIEAEYDVPPDAWYFAANRQSLPEVVGDAGVLFEPQDVEALARALTRVHEEPGFRSELINRGRRRRAQFSWRSAAAATAAIYEELATRR